MSERTEKFERNREYVSRQVQDELKQAIEAARTRRGANLVLEASALLQFSTELDTTNEFIAELDRTLESIGTSAPAQTAGR